MNVEWFRDFGIGMFTWIGTVLVIVLIILSVFVFVKMRTIIGSVQVTARTVEEAVVAIRDGIVNPVTQVGTFIQFVAQFVDRLCKGSTKGERDGGGRS